MDYKEEIQMKCEMMEDDIDGMKDFMLEKLCQFKARVDDLEEKFSKRVTLTSETPKPSTSMETKPLIASAPAISDKVRQDIQKFMPEDLDPKEKLNKIEYAYFMYWISVNDVKGRKEEAKQLEEDGQEAGVWCPENFTGKVEFVQYLHDKLRGYVRKVRRGQKRKEMEVAYNLPLDLV